MRALGPALSLNKEGAVSYVGIDSGTRQTGFVALTKRGRVVRKELLVQRVPTHIERLHGMRDLLRTLLEGETITAVAIEEPYMSTFRPRAGVVLLQLQGALCMLMHDLGIKRIFPVRPGDVKAFASGRLQTHKNSLGAHVYKRWRFDDRSPDVVDAFILAQVARCIDNPKGFTSAQRQIAEAVRAHGFHRDRQIKERRTPARFRKRGS